MLVPADWVRTCLFPVWGKSVTQWEQLVTEQVAAGMLPLDDLASMLGNEDFLCSHTVLLREKEVSRNRPVTRREEIGAALANGMSLQVRQLERILPASTPMLRLAREVENSVGHPLSSATLFVSPPGDQALPRHSDDYDVIVIQLLGIKRWLVGDSEFVVRAGDALYIPAQQEHEAISMAEATSISVSLLFKPLRISDLLSAWLTSSPSETLRRRLPAFWPNNLPDEVRDQFELAADDIAQALEHAHGTWAELAQRLSLANLPPPAVDLNVSHATTPRFSRTSARWKVRFSGLVGYVHVQGGSTLEVPVFLEGELERLAQLQGCFHAADVAVNASEKECLLLLRKLQFLGVLREVTP